MKSICLSVVLFVTILEIVSSMSVSKDDAAATDEMVKPEIKQHFEAASPKASEPHMNHEMKRSLDVSEAPRSERCSWFGNRPQYYPARPYYPQGSGYYPGGGSNYYPGGSNYYPGTGGNGGSYPGGYQNNGVGTNFLGNGAGYGGYGGFGGNGRLPTYYGYNANDYDGNRNLGYGYYRRTNLDGMPGRKTMSSSYYMSSPRPSYDNYGYGGYRGYE